jgi:hypothetical protein
VRSAPARAVVALVLFLIGTASAAADDTASLGAPITDPAEIAHRMAGNTLKGILKETGRHWAEYYCDTGRSLYAFGGISLGKWWTENGRVCFAYEDDNYRHPICFSMYAKPDGSLTFFTRDFGGTMTFISRPPVPGDPLHLEERAPHGCALEPSV